jgi:hypothetical protein
MVALSLSTPLTFYPGMQFVEAILVAWLALGNRDNKNQFSPPKPPKIAKTSL